MTDGRPGIGAGAQSRAHHASHRSLRSFHHLQEETNGFFGYDSEEEGRGELRPARRFAKTHTDGTNDSYEGLFHRMRQLREQAAAGISGDASERNDDFVSE